jgi:hypothetical protein
MGETGAGITAEDQIRMDEENEFTNKWSACSGHHTSLISSYAI